MELLLTVLIFIALIGLSNVLYRFLPFIPVPLIQMALGALVAIIPPGIHLELEPEVFFILFIAPLLFHDGKRTPREDLWNLRAPILLMALGLVFATVLVAGYAIHWMIPSLSLPASFALAAILSPTDAVAVGAMAKRIHLPKRVLRLLEGEALMNDASGLVAFKFALGAAMTGSFSLSKAAGSFVLIAVGGLLVGAVLAFLIIRLSLFLRRLGMEDVTTHMLLQLLTPFFIYIVSEELGLSGILAVVAGGVIHAIERDRTASPHFKLQVVSASTWTIVIFVLNGLVFVILGAVIPGLFHTVFRSAAFDNLKVIGYVVAITALLILIRFVWLLLISRGSTLKAAVVTSLSGVRGAVTLVGALSIPFFLDNGQPFPQRDLILFLAGGVILLSLLIASIVLPILMKGSEEPEDAEKAAFDGMVGAGVEVLRRAMKGEHSAHATAMINRFQERTRRLQRADDGKRENGVMRRLEAELRIVGLRAEREELARLEKAARLSPELADQLGDIVDRTESLLVERLDDKFISSWAEVRRLVSSLFAVSVNGGDDSACTDGLSVLEAKAMMAEAAIRAVQASRNEQNHAAADVVLAHYGLLKARVNSTGEDCKERKRDAQQLHKSGIGQDEAQKEPSDEQALPDDRELDLQIHALQGQRDYVEELYEKGEINRKLAAKLRRFVNELETAILEEG
ncbi:Na+/H+ antiporter [Paenibacillus spongiae]|uniref:Na+/H+ antiporter n=1 Tax=Paenibacillus spongiae TaxID=2909671 RepID=A0ABY5SA06_9BACL|nr:Na+/H+ antiporter [Paenibacillus spongiae]UVI29620.1 Na+/H+ antiporter [Paenibacillus spongiae]